MNKRETGLVGCAVRAVTALGLLLVSSLSVAQLNCNPSTPRTDPGAEFVAFGEREQLLARGGNAGPAWEWALGPDTDVDGQNVKASHDWVSGKVYSWTLSYAGTSASVELRDGGTLLFTRTFATGMDRGNALHFQVNTNPSIGPTTTIAATVTQIAGNAVAGSLSQTGNNQEAVQNLYFFFPGMAAGFTAQGTVTLTYASLPSGSRVDFRVRAGTISCTSTNAPPTVTISSPVGGENFQFPTAAIPVTANAQDSDGTVTQVEFFASGAPIGTATGPFTIQWTNVAVGDYTLTARATDNAGAQTTSTAINVSVRVPQVFYMHTDHLNTPRVITNQVGQAVWRYDNTDPFGGNVPDENPSGLGTFTCNLRFPGTYADQETGLLYNWNRTLDTGIGRYIQFDPIGLEGGINGYAYVGGNPISRTDPFGLAPVGSIPSDPNQPAIFYNVPRRTPPSSQCGCPGQSSSSQAQQAQQAGQALGGLMLGGAGAGAITGLALGVAATGTEIGSSVGLIGAAGAAALGGKAAMTGLVLGGAAGACVGLVVAGVIYFSPPSCTPCSP